MASMIDRCAGKELIRNIAIAFYLTNEGISILENVGKMGVRYPKKIKQILVQLRDGEKND